MVLFDHDDRVPALDGARGAEQDLLLEAFDIDLDVVDVPQVEHVEGVDRGRTRLHSSTCDMAAGIHLDLADVVAQRATVMSDLAQVNIAAEIRPDPRVERVRVLEIELKVAGIFAYPATHIDRRAEVLDVRLAQQIG